MRSAMQLIVKSSLAVVLVLGLSLSTIPAHAVAIYSAQSFGMLTWGELPDGVVLGSDFQPPSLQMEVEGGSGNFDSNAAIAFGGGSSSITAQASVSGFAAPTGWANSSAKATNFLQVINTNEPNGAVSDDVEFTWNGIASMAGSVDDPLTETAFASVSVFALFAENLDPPIFKEDEVLAAFGNAPPNFVENNLMGELQTILSIPRGQTLFIGVQANAAGEAHSDPNNVIPEPASILLLGSGMIGLGAWQWRRQKRHQNAA